MDKSDSNLVAGIKNNYDNGTDKSIKLKLSHNQLIVPCSTFYKRFYFQFEVFFWWCFWLCAAWYLSPNVLYLIPCLQGTEVKLTTFHSITISTENPLTQMILFKKRLQSQFNVYFYSCGCAHALRWNKLCVDVVCSS